MSIFYPIPLVDQLAEPVTDNDGQGDNNASANCVPASLSSALEWFTGRAYNGDELKDVVYGVFYQGATDPRAYIPYLAAQGVSMQEIACTGTAATDAVIAALEAGELATGAIPSQWGNTTWADIQAHGGSTHEIMFCGYDAGAGTLTAMNPWPLNGAAFYQVQGVQWWADRLCYLHVFTLREGPVSITIDRDGAGNVTGAHDAALHTSVGAGMAQVIAAHPDWQAADLAIGEIFGLSEKATAAVLRGATKQVLVYTAQNGVSVYSNDIADVVQDLFTAWQEAKSQPAGTPVLTINGVKQTAATILIGAVNA